MKIVVTGTRGFPGILGGVETHSEELYPRIAALGHEVIVIRRTPYLNEQNRLNNYRGVKFVDIYAPKKKSFEAVFHTFLAVIKAKQLGADILHIHAIGPAIMTPLARLFGLKVVMTHHGSDYMRQKWGRLAKTVLKRGEKMGARYSNRIIAISRNIADFLSQKYGNQNIDLIFNGVNRPSGSYSGQYLHRMSLDRKPYILAAGRFVKEKGFHDLIDAFLLSGLSDRFNLVIAGDADHPDEYSEMLKKKATDAGVILTGFIKGEPLDELMSSAALFVLPSYHEGLPITLLEAMSHGADVVVSDISANRLAELDAAGDFFPVGNVAALAEALKRKTANIKKRDYDLAAYNWDNIALSTLRVYSKALER